MDIIAINEKDYKQSFVGKLYRTNENKIVFIVGYDELLEVIKDIYSFYELESPDKISLATGYDVRQVWQEVDIDDV